MNFGFAISLVLVGFAIVGVFIEIPFVSNYAFWVAIGAYVIFSLPPRTECAAEH